MRAITGLLVFCIVTEQIACEGNFTASNETISSKTEKPFLKKVFDFYKGIISADKNNSSATGDNSTFVSSTDNPPIHNTTGEQPANQTAGATASTGVTKSSETTFNNSKENASTANEKGDELKATTTTAIENSTTEDSFASNATRVYPAGHSEISESVLNATTASEEPDSQAAGENSSNPNNTDDEILIDDDSALPEELERAAQEHQIITNASVVSDIAPHSEQHEEYCKIYFNKLISAMLTEHAAQLDPFLLNGGKTAFEVPFLSSSPRGHLEFYNGKMTGFSQVEPYGRCIVKMKDDQIRLTSDIYINQSLISYNGGILLMDFRSKIAVLGKLEGISTEVGIVVPREGGIGKIETFRTMQPESMEIDVKGLGEFYFLTEFIDQPITDFLTLVCIRIIETDLRKALEDEITKIRYP